jgi:hypothetical protein
MRKHMVLTTIKEGVHEAEIVNRCLGRRAGGFDELDRRMRL